MAIEAPPAPAAFRGSAPFLAKAPPFWLPMRHFVAAAAAFLAFAFAFALGGERYLGFDMDARWVLGLTHVLTLGWITATLFGALCQLAPVLWETSLASERLAAGAFWLFVGGAAAFVGQLWAGGDRYWLAAVPLTVSVGLYLWVFGRTMASAVRLDWTGRHLALAFAYLAGLVTLGLLLALDRGRAVWFKDPEGALIAHVHLALVGWVSLAIVGVSYRLVSMFALSHVESRWLGRLTLALGNAGLLGLSVDSLFCGRKLMPLWACLLAGAYLAYVAHMRKLFASRLKRIDPALAFTLFALVGGAAWCSLGVALAFGWLENSNESRLAYVFCALVGWVTPFILGQIHKIVPFLVWLHVYSPRNWKPPVRVPKIEDLTSERLAWLELASLVGAAAAGTLGFLRESYPALRVSGWLLAACATLYAANTAVTLSHVVRRDPRWTNPQQP